MRFHDDVFGVPLDRNHCRPVFILGYQLFCVCVIFFPCYLSPAAATLNTFGRERRESTLLVRCMLLLYFLGLGGGLVLGTGDLMVSDTLDFFWGRIRPLVGH